MTETLTPTKEAEKLAIELVNLELDRLEITQKQAELKEKILFLIEENGANPEYQLQQGTVLLSETTSYKVADSVKEELETKVKDASKLNPEFLDYVNNDVKLNKAAKLAIIEGDVDLLAMVEENVKKKIVVKIG